MTLIDDTRHHGGEPPAVATRRAAPDSTRLLQHGRPSRASRLGSGSARRIVRSLLERMTSGSLTVTDVDGSTTTFGPGGRAASITIHDPRAWWAVATEGSVGLGRGYLEGWWDTDDVTGVLRVVIPNLETVNDLRARVAAVRNPITDPIRRVLPGRGRHGDKEDIGSHYDISNAFFATFLDETMSYSSAVFTDDDQDLGAASLHKYDRLLDKVGVDVGQSLLEIGTGWGGLAIRAAGTRGCTVTTTTISEEQHLEASRRIDDAGLHAVDVRLDDWRDLDGSFDRIVSIEMIEAVDYRDYPAFFQKLESCLAPDGLIGLQAICVPGQRYEAAKRRDDFIRRFVFPGGMLPSIDAVVTTVSAHTRLHLVDVEDLSAHYAETLRRWRVAFDDAERDLADLGLDARFRRLWRFYLAYCEAGFDERLCTVNQFVLVGPDWRPDGLALRPH